MIRGITVRMPKTIPMTVAFRSAGLGAGGALAALVTVGSLNTALAADSGTATYRFDIPAQKLNDALQEVALASQHKLLYSSKLVDGRKSPALKGEYAAEEAVGKLLVGTGLECQVTADGLMVIREAADKPSSQLPQPSGWIGNRDRDSNGMLRLASLDDTQEQGAIQGKDKTPGQTGAGPNEEGGSKNTVDTVVVTGSRIKTAGFDAPTPTTVVGAAELRLAGRTDIGAALADLPQFRLTQSATSTNVFTESGITPADLRGLGAARTLVLVNNRRYVSAGDLQAVPYSLVERVDVVTGGVSAAYGSDAVAGVVNIILDDKKEGVELGVQGGRSTHGDGDKYLFEGSGGVSFADGRGHAMIGVDYLKDLGVTPGIRRPRIGGATFYPGEDGRLYQAMNLHEALRTEGGLIDSGVLAGQTFNPDGSLRPFEYGFRSPISPVYMVGGEGYYIDNYASLSAPIERTNALARATYQISDTLRVWAEGVYNRTADERPFFPELTIFTLDFPADNPFLSQSIRDMLASAGETSLTLGRVLTDVAFNRYDYDDTTRQLSVGVEGSFADDRWRYEAFYSYGHKVRNQRINNLVRGAEFFNAIDAVVDPVGGDIVCRVALIDPTTGCAPLNLFGSGNASQAAMNYVTGNQLDREDVWLQNVGVNISGEPFRLWGEPVSLAFGGEYRKNDFASHWDKDSLAGRFLLIQGVDIAKTGIDVKEAFVEVAVPLLVGVPFAKKLTFNGAARNSDYSTSGSIWSWKLGGTWDVSRDVRFRLTRSRDIRAPNLTELYTAAGVLLTQVSDVGQEGTPITDVTAHGGGNPRLQPELADTFTAGILLSPSALPGFNFAVDYYDIEINDVISQLSVQQVVNSCYNDGIQSACDQITRNAGGEITDIDVTWINIARFQTKGFDIEASYRIALEALGMPGSLSMRAIANYTDKMTLFNGVSTVDGAGYIGSQAPYLVPKWRGSLTTIYESERIGGDFRVRYINQSQYVPPGVLSNVGANDVAARFYFDLGLRAYVPFGDANRLAIYANVQNLLDRQPPVGTLLSPYYDLVGRYFTLGVRANF